MATGTIRCGRLEVMDELIFNEMPILSSMPGLSGQMGTIGVITGPTLVPFDDFWYNSGAVSYSPVTKRFTINETGLYRITFNPFKNTGATAIRVLIGKNTDYPTSANHYGSCYSSSSVYETLMLDSVISLVEGDYIVFYLLSGSMHNATGDRFNQFSIMKLTGIIGKKGDKGDTSTITVGTVTPGVDPEDASVTNVGTINDAIFNFVLPSGQAATIAVGDVITSELAPSVINSGTERDAIFDFNLPKGDKGDTGDTAGVARGSSTFMGNSTVRTIAHGLGFVPSFVYIMQSENPAGYLGETWYTTDITNLYIYNTGSATTAFVWMAF